MVVSVTIEEIIADLRLADTPAQRGLAQRRLDYATVAVTKYAPNAPDEALNEAVSRLAGYLFDQPTVAGGAAFTNALRNSGATNILMPYRIHGLGYAEAMDEVNQAVGSVGNPVTGLAIVGDQLTVTFADGTEEVLMLPAGMGGMFSGVDQQARDDAAAALARADLGVSDAATAQAPAADTANVTANDVTAEVAALPVPTDWASEGNTDEIPLDKFGNAIRGHRVYIQTSPPDHGQIGDVWIRDSRNTHPELYEWTGIGWQVDYSFFGGRVHYKTTAHNVSMDSPNANRDDLLFELVSGTLKIYRRLFSSSAPYWEALGTVAGGTGGGGGEGLTAASVTGLAAAAADEIHSSVIFPGVFGGILRKFSFGNLIALMRSTVGLGRQINPGGSTNNLGKVPVLHEDGADFHYQLQSPVELPSIASNVPNSPAHMNPAILYKDTPDGDTATEIYYKRRHDRESVVIAINDTSPRSFGTEHRSFGWTSRIILDTAEPVPGVSPYPSVPPHWEAFIRVQNIASGLYEWRLYTDELFTTLDTIYLDMRDQDDPDTHIQNVAMTKPVNEAYWSTGTYAFNTFPFYSVAGRGRRPVIRIRNEDDTLSTSIIHLIPVDDVREALVDEDRLHDVYGDILDVMSERFDNLPSGGGETAAIFRSGGDAQLSQIPIATNSFLLTIPAAALRGGQTYLLMGECDAQMGFTSGGWVETHMQVFGGATSLLLDRERTQPVTTSENPRHSHSHFTTWTCPDTPVDVRLAMRWGGTVTLSLHGFAVTHSRLVLIPIEAM